MHYGVRVHWSKQTESTPTAAAIGQPTPILDPNRNPLSASSNCEHSLSFHGSENAHLHVQMLLN